MTTRESTTDMFDFTTQGTGTSDDTKQTTATAPHTTTQDSDSLTTYPLPQTLLQHQHPPTNTPPPSNITLLVKKFISKQQKTQEKITQLQTERNTQGQRKRRT